MLGAASMAGHTAIVDLLDGGLLEREDFRDITAAGDMLGSGAMAGFASLARRSAFGVQSRLPVRRLLPTVVEVFVADLAGFRANVIR